MISSQDQEAALEARILKEVRHQVEQALSSQRQPTLEPTMNISPPKLTRRCASTGQPDNDETTRGYPMDDITEKATCEHILVV